MKVFYKRKLVVKLFATQGLLDGARQRRLPQHSSALYARCSQANQELIDLLNQVDRSDPRALTGSLVSGNSDCGQIGKSR